MNLCIRISSVYLCFCILSVYLLKKPDLMNLARSRFKPLNGRPFLPAKRSVGKKILQRLKFKRFTLEAQIQIGSKLGVALTLGWSWQLAHCIGPATVSFSCPTPSCSAFTLLQSAPVCSSLPHHLTIHSQRSAVTAVSQSVSESPSHSVSSQERLFLTSGGGESWQGATPIAGSCDHVAPQLRREPLPSQSVYFNLKFKNTSRYRC